MRAGATVATVRPSEVTAQRACPPDGRRGPAGGEAADELGPRPEVALELDGVSVARLGHRTIARTGSSLRVRRGEVVGVAGVEGNGQAELDRGDARPVAAHRRDRSGSTAAMQPAGPGARRRGGSRLHRRRTASARACCSTRRSGRTGSWATSAWRPTAAGRGSRRERRGPTRARIVAEADVRTPVDRRRGVRAVGRQPAEADRGPRAGRVAPACSSPPIRRGAWTWARRPPSGRASGVPATTASRSCSSAPTSRSSSRCPTGSW